MQQIRDNTIGLKLHENLGKIQVALTQLGFDRELYDSAEECKKLIETKQYNVAVMGEFKRGKSTIINALLGAAILPANATPTTATVNRITYGREKKGVVRFKDGSEKEIGLDELVGYVTKLTSDSKKQAAEVLEAVVYYPTVIGQNNIDIIDTPGLDDDEDMTRITLGMIDSVDAVVVPIHAKSPFSETEAKFVCQLISSSGIDNIVFVVNFMDMLHKGDYVYETYMDYIKNRIQTEVINILKERKSDEDVIARAHRLLDDISVCGISAQLALESFAANNRQKIEESRFEEFEELLRCSVTTKQVDNAFDKTINSIKHIVSKFESQDKKRRYYFDRKTEEIQSSESAFSGYSGDADKFLNGVFAEDYEKIANVMQEVDEYKKLIKEVYIKELSTVRENTDASISAALGQAFINAGNVVKRKEPHKRIYEVFDVSAKRLINYRKEKLGGIFERLGISGGNLSMESLTASTETVLMKNNKTKFDWSVSPALAGNLAKINVIDVVMRAANTSVDNYKRELENAAAAIRTNWFRQFDEDKDRVKNVVTKAIQAQKEELDSQKTAYVHLYRVFSESSKAILSECESIRAESK